MSGHRIVQIKNEEEAMGLLKQIGVDQGAYPYLQPKSLCRCLLLKSIPCRAALIIKQEMLSKGGDAAISREALHVEGTTDVLLMGTLKHYQQLLPKLKLQPFGLKKVAEDVQAMLKGFARESWTIPLTGGRSLNLGSRTLIMGVLNITPDSFSDGGRYYEPDIAIMRAREMREEGADIIDVGGVSTRPDADLIDEGEELRRVVPVVKRLLEEGFLVSVDTFRAGVARECLQAGAHLINDVGAGKMDSQMFEVLARYQAPTVLMHNRLQIDRGKPYQDILADITEELKAAIEAAKAAGLPEDLILIDPGIGFGKDPAQNRLLIQRLTEFRSLGRPIVVGASRKRFIGSTLDLEVGDRLEGSLAVAVMAIMNGGSILRVHDVKETKRAAAMTDAVLNEWIN